MSDADQSPTSDAAAAFDGLRQEVKLLRKAVAAWVDEQPDPPDYSETLGKIAGDLSRTSTRVGWLTQRPALALTPDEMAQRIKAAGEDARTTDRKLIMQALDGFQRATDALSGWTVQARTADLQARRLLQIGAITGAIGLAVGLILPAAIMGNLSHHRASAGRSSPLLPQDPRRAGTPVSERSMSCKKCLIVAPEVSRPNRGGESFPALIS